MIARAVLPSALHATLAAQSGVVSRAQCLAMGVSRHVVDRMLAQGTWSVIARGVLGVWDPLPWLGMAWTGLLLGGSGAVLGGRTAARLHGLSVPSEGPIEVWVGRGRRLRSGERFSFVAGARRGVGEPARTTVADTVLDVARSLDDDALCRLVADAVSQRRVSVARLAAALAARERYPRRQLLRDLIGDVAGGAHSPLERRYLRDVERAHGLPRGVRQLAGADGTRPDVRYPKLGVIVELDGRQFHRGSRRFDDLARDLDHLLAGQLTVRLGWTDVTSDACVTAAKLAALFVARGWGGVKTACPRCARLSM